MTLLIDTSGLLAAMFADQRHHEECARVLRESQPLLIISPFVLAEADYLIQKYAGVHAELLFLGEIARGAYQLVMFDVPQVEQARQLVEKYRDLGIGLADASIVVLAGLFDCRDVLTLDMRHFRALRPPGRRSFRILPADL